MRFRSMLFVAFALSCACDKSSSSSGAPGAPSAAGVAPSAAARGSAAPGTSASPPEARLRLTRSVDPQRDGGLSFFQYRFESPASSGLVWVVRLDLGQTQIELHQSGKPSPLSQVLADSRPKRGAFAAINGGFYGRDERPMGLVIAAGRELSPKTRSGGSGIFSLTARGAVVVHRDEPLPLGAQRVALQSIDRLVDAGRSLVKKRDDPPRDARSAVAVRADGSVLFVVAFDRRAAQGSAGDVTLNAESTSTGMTLAEFAEVLAAPEARGGLGAKTALNLDGGMSTSMELRVGDRERRVVAHRATTNALLARPR